MDEISRIRSALTCLDPSMSRDDWVKVGMAIKSELGDKGFQIFDEWSQGGSNYNAADARDAWKSIKPNGPVTIATLFKLAKDQGWKDAHRPKADVPKPPTIQANEVADRDLEEKRAQAARKALELWKTSLPAKADNPYLNRKGVKPTATLREAPEKLVKSVLGYAPKSDGKLLSGRILVVPVKVGDKLSTIELIDENGLKTALAGGAKSGGFWCSAPLKKGADSPKSILVAEGVATALSASEATEYPAIASLSVGNMEKTALALKKRFPEARIVILADIDKSTGQAHQHAQKAAERVGGILIAPDFGQERHPHETDFNDMHASRGLEAVSKCIFDAVNRAADDVAPGRKSLSRTKSQSPGESGKPPPFESQGGRFEVDDEGVRFSEKKDGEWRKGILICSRLDILAATRDRKGAEWGRLLSWRDRDGTAHQWAMPLELLQSDGADVRRELARRGLHIEPSKTARDKLTAYIQVWPTNNMARCTERLGWVDDSFVLPSGAVGNQNEHFVFQNQSAIEPAIETKGTLEQWQESVSIHAKGNSRLTFAISAMFAGALLDLATEDGGGFHLLGGSSNGKTSTLKVAASVWGRPDRYTRTWRATSNALEGLASMHNDGALILDEITQIDPKEVGNAAYMLANGEGKNRSGRTGIAKQPARWKLIFLSSGEDSIETLLAKAGMKPMAGQEIRLANIEADAGAGFGAFECLHGFDNPSSFAEAIKESAHKFYGSAGIAWIQYVVQERNKIQQYINEKLKEFVDQVTPSGSSGQVFRVARRFGIVAMAGELATFCGITKWEIGAATEAAKRCFHSWIELFGGPGDKESRTIVERVNHFLSLHGSARFETIEDRKKGDPRTINRVGFYKKNDDGVREYWVFPSMLTTEICPGYQTSVITSALLKAGILIPSKNGDSKQSIRLPDMGSPKKVYVLHYNDEANEKAQRPTA